MLTQWCLGVGWPFDLPSCLLCPCQTWAVILQCFSWDKECCWIHWCMSSPCITRYPAKILLCSLWVFQELQNLHTYKPVFFSYPNSGSVVCWEKSCNDSHLYVSTVPWYGCLLSAFLLVARETSLHTETITFFLGRSILFALLTYSCFLTCLTYTLCSPLVSLGCFSFGDVDGKKFFTWSSATIPFLSFFYSQVS